MDGRQSYIADHKLESAVISYRLCEFCSFWTLIQSTILLKLNDYPLYVLCKSYSEQE